MANGDLQMIKNAILNLAKAIHVKMKEHAQMREITSGNVGVPDIGEGQLAAQDELLMKC